MQINKILRLKILFIGYKIELINSSYIFDYLMENIQKNKIGKGYVSKISPDTIKNKYS